MKINSREELNHLQEYYSSRLNAQKKRILVCAGTGCVAGGSLLIYDRLKELMEEKGICCEVVLEEEPHDPSLHSVSAGTDGCCAEGKEPIGLKKSGCHGFCEMGPLLRIDPEGLLYIKVKVEDCEEIIEKSILKDEIVDHLVYQDHSLKSYPKQEDIPFYKKQTRVALEYCGHINAESVREYIGVGGYSAVAKALFDMTPQQIVDEITESCLRGRGGRRIPHRPEMGTGSPSDRRNQICCLQR